MSGTKQIKDKSIPEPPKFNIESLPEPPKMDTLKDKEMKIPSSGLDEKKQIIPPPPQLQETQKPEEETKIEDLSSPKKDLNEDFLQELPPPPMLEKEEKKKGFFSRFFKRKQKEEEEKIDLFKPLSEEPIDIPISQETEEQPSLDSMSDFAFAPPDMKPQTLETKEDLSSDSTNFNLPDLPEMKTSSDEQIGEEKLMQREDEMYEEGEHFVREEEMLEEGEAYIEKTTPLQNVKGIGEAREKKLKRAGIKTAEHLLKYDFKTLSKKIKIPESQAKSLISNAKKITNIKQKLKKTKIKDEKGISEVIKQLETERRKIDIMKKSEQFDEDKIIELEGHEELVGVLEALEQRRKELSLQEQKLTEKEIKLSTHDETYRREIEQIENLRRRLDHDIRERTQYLINLEKDYFKRGQILAKKQSDVEAKEKEVDERHKLLKEREDQIKLTANEIEDRTINLNVKAKKYEKIMRDLEKQDVLLKEKEEDLLKRESEYMKRLDTLEAHEKSILRNLEEKRKKLETKEKEISVRESVLHKKERNVDKKSVAVEYQKDIIESEKGKLVDDEFEQYLHNQLGMLKSTGINIDDMNFVNNLSIPSVVRGNSIYQLIDTCRDLVKSNRVTEAKVFYNQVRDKYYGSKFSSDREKESVHNLIRTLYDEINLADIGRNR